MRLEICDSFSTAIKYDGMALSSHRLSHLTLVSAEHHTLDFGVTIQLGLCTLSDFKNSVSVSVEVCRHCQAKTYTKVYTELDITLMRCKGHCVGQNVTEFD